MRKLYNDKQEAIKQWTNDPCGISRANGFQIGTKEFYKKVDESRYEIYAPWMRSVIGFDNYPGKKVLEIGFGMGTDLFQFACAGSIVSGIDLSTQHIDLATKRFKLYKMEADLLLSDAENLPFDDETFDVIYTFGVIHHTPDTEKSVKEIYRVLKFGGKAIIGVYHRYSAFYLFQIIGPFIWKFRFLKESYRKTLSRIEHRENSDACPLVKLYNRRKLMKMLQSFSIVNIECVHLKKIYFGPLRKLLPSKLLPRLENRYGWYLIAKCIK